MGPVTGTDTGGGAGVADGVETVTVVMGEGTHSVVVVTVTNGCAMGGPGECPSLGVSLAADTVLNSGAFEEGASTAWLSYVSMVRSGREGRGVVAGMLRNGVADADRFGAELTSGKEFEVTIEEDMGMERDVGRGEAGTSNCMLPPARPGGGGDKAWFASIS
jgi:hypothetical protein